MSRINVRLKLKKQKTTRNRKAGRKAGWSGSVRVEMGNYRGIKNFYTLSIFIHILCFYDYDYYYFHSHYLEEGNPSCCVAEVFI